MKPLVAFVAVVVLIALAWVGVDSLGLVSVFGTAVPYLAFLLFAVGVIAKVVGWARSPVPFHIPTTCGQQKSLPWIPQNKLDNPSSKLGVLGRMALEVLLFRSLFRNTETELRDGKLAYHSDKWLWAAGLAFHWSMLVIVVRHLRLMLEPVPGVVTLLAAFDGFLQVGVPSLYITSLVFVGAVGYLLVRRLYSPRVRYMSLLADYFPLFLLLAIACTGLWLRHVEKIDIPAAKSMILGLTAFSPRPAALGWVFYAHLFLVSTLVAYFPFSKLMHMAGVFFSPTRNLANDSRARRHVNPWGRPLPVHTYEEYEDEFRDRMRDAGLPLDKE